MKRWIFFAYGVSCYLIFLATYAWMAAFVGGFLMPKTIDSPSTSPVKTAIAVNLLLLSLFGLQHSVMARPGFKRFWTKLVPQPIERSTYVLVSCIVTVLLIWQWRAIDIVVWNVEQPMLRAALWSLFAAGWLMVPVVSLLINHFDLFGTRQVWLYLRGKEYIPLPFGTPLLYNHVRHPLYIGWAVLFWATPTMTLGHLQFAAVLTLYMIVATVFEERDLLAHFGWQYAEYRERVPRFVPRLSTNAELFCDKNTPCL